MFEEYTRGTIIICLQIIVLFICLVIQFSMYSIYSCHNDLVYVHVFLYTFHCVYSSYSNFIYEFIYLMYLVYSFFVSFYFYYVFGVCFIEVVVNTILSKETPPPPGGVFYLLCSLIKSRVVCKRFHDEMRRSHLVVKSFTHGS